MSSAYAYLDNNWKLRAQNEVLEDPDKVVDNISALKNLLRDEPELYPRTDDTFLLAFLRARKHDVNEAFTLLKRFYEVKKNYPVHFEDCLPTEKGYIYDIEGLTVLDQCDNDERIVIVLRVEKADLKKVTIENLFQQLSTTLSFFLEDQRVQISGISIIMDLKGFGFKHLFALTPSSALLLTRLFQDCFPIRLKAIHVVNEPIFIGSLFSLFKPFIKEKLRKRIHFHGTNLSSLHACLPYEILPRQLGGMVPDFNFTTFRRIFEENEDVIRGWRKFGYNKTLQNYIMK
ncbi:clavesin-2-like isoform X2 [Schistocerca piceifrons]|uniref:clavesin-2-like isoform X2 n=1 Tax=Schistocerca piceifrons TaxID=274613 RepID=UPI001F5EF127|nr:clavesin-2-like isoform X2 [Schistocerca piceifrons]XP_047105570.1 clavesin-2-like isoform X2 [Schistocerca piceifrons]XP_047105571.1 clavesin-2-like isoform X2 [Schistocerca piceifrons]XP_047105572.1 clavesin-2-like isoform X2 [Schistocerca piceifrons]XP_047105573.1 clavesin-2-like isoform X2 [Schistocerca piceifrons]